MSVRLLLGVVACVACSMVLVGGHAAARAPSSAEDLATGANAGAACASALAAAACDAVAANSCAGSRDACAKKKHRRAKKKAPEAAPPAAEPSAAAQPPGPPRPRTKAELVKAQASEGEAEVWVTPPGVQREQRASEGDTLEPGSKVRTGNATTAELQLLEAEASLRLAPRTNITLSGVARRDSNPTAVVSTIAGKLWARVTALVKGGESFRVTAPNAVCGVRGTEFEVTVADDGSSMTSATEGTVAVGGGLPGDEQQLVGRGQAVIADEEKGAVGAVTDASEAGDPDAWAQERQNDLRNNVDREAPAIGDRLKGKVEARQEIMGRLLADQQQIKKELAAAQRQGDEEKAQELREQLEDLADVIADIAVQAGAQVGFAQRLAALAKEFGASGVSEKHLREQAASLSAVLGDLERMAKEGMDLSIEGMEKTIGEMREGPKGPDSNSAADDLFKEGPADPF